MNLQVNHAEFLGRPPQWLVDDIVAQCKSEGFHGETMPIEMATTDCNEYGFDLQLRMSETETNQKVALGKVGIVFFTQGDRKVTPIPQPS